jgi:hypothetical protein
MLYQPDLMIYVWMLPIIGFVLLPFMWSATCMLYKGIERSRFANVKGFVEVSTPTPEGDVNIEKRHQTRVQIEAPKAVVACQIKCCTTHVSNISSKGICLSNLPQKMIKEGSNKFRVIFRSREREYAMFVQPRWSKLGDNGFKIGAEILTIPAGWEGFVNEFCQPSLAKAA